MCDAWWTLLTLTWPVEYTCFELMNSVLWTLCVMFHGLFKQRNCLWNMSALVNVCMLSCVWYLLDSFDIDMACGTRMFWVNEFCVINFVCNVSWTLQTLACPVDHICIKLMNSVLLTYVRCSNDSPKIQTLAWPVDHIIYAQVKEFSVVNLW